MASSTSRGRSQLSFAHVWMFLAAVGGVLFAIGCASSLSSPILGVGSQQLVFWGPVLSVASLVGWFAVGDVNLPSDEHIEWQLDVFEWFLAHFPDHGTACTGAVPTPSEVDFPVGQARGLELGERLFESVRKWAGMADWPCKLVCIDDTRPEHGMVGRSDYGGAAGTFSIDDQKAVITYGVSGLARPERLIATFAHELGHYLMAYGPGAPPGGDEAEEPATDLCAVYLGFGIFSANAAFSFEGLSSFDREGWQVERHGYLDENALAVALAIFAAVFEIPAEQLSKHLDTNPRVYFEQARRHLYETFPERIEALRARVVR